MPLQGVLLLVGGKDLHNICNFSKSPGIFKGYGNKLPGKGNRFSSASNALTSWVVRFLYEIESIGRLPGLFEKLLISNRTGRNFGVAFLLSKI
jgi:hypothetical protein